MTNIFQWKHDFPVAPYLMLAVASVYQERRSEYRRVAALDSTPVSAGSPAGAIVPVQEYFWAVDDTNATTRNGRVYSVRATFSDVVRTMTAYSRWFGEYPFEKFASAVIQPFWAGGMEHQTIQTVNRNWLRGTATGVAHEIMHHWIGNKVTCSTWADIWLNEGGATYGEVLWYESWGGEFWRQEALKNFRAVYFRGPNSRPLYIADYATQGVDTLFNYALTYCKAALVYDMLRSTVGDSLFFHAMRHHLKRFAHGSASTQDFQESFEQAIPTPPVPFATFFRQWAYGSRHPIYDMVWRSDALQPSASSGSGSGSGSGVPTAVPADVPSEVTVKIQQLQSGANIPDVFVMPLTLTFLRIAGTDTLRQRQTFVNTERSQTARFTVPFAPTRVILDENNAVLSERTNRTLNLQKPDSTLRGEPLRLNVYPQPITAGEALTTEITLAAAQQVRVEVVDVLGRTISTLFAGTLPKGTSYLHWTDSRSATSDSFAQGAYFLRVLSSENTTVASRRILVLR
jgi:hypothetical protein